MDSGRLETAPSGAVHLDTVRALHQTVVSLRTALEVSKNELKQLKEKYEQHSHCLEYADVIEKLTLENHILRRKIIDSGFDDKDEGSQDIKLEVTYSPHLKDIEDNTGSDAVIVTTIDKNNQSGESEPIISESDENTNFCSSEKLNDVPEEILGSPVLNVSAEFTPPDVTNNNTEVEEFSQIPSLPKDTGTSEDQHQPHFKTKLELLSKFDVRIKVRTIKEDSVISSTTSDSDSSEFKRGFNKDIGDFNKNTDFRDKEESFDKKENINKNTVNIKSFSTESVKMAVPNEADVKNKTDKFGVQVRITSEENLVVKENMERSRRKDTLNLDVDDLSLRSMSEGDNSVFSEGGTTPADPNAAAVSDDKHEDNASGNESEEVDDIELIFTTDESKDMSNLQEDLVSIRETEHWVPQTASTTHSTPVLIKFHTLDPDFQPGVETKSTENRPHIANISENFKQKRVSLPNDKEIRHVAFNGKGNLELPGRSILKSCDNKSDITLYRKSPNTSTRRLDSIDSLTCEYNRGLSFDNTKSSSFELGSSMDILHRDESVDSFHRNMHMGHRYSVFAETDISKCGTSEEDLAFNLNMRRNTCPNPFQYRPVAYRGVSRPPGPFKAGSSRLRPVLRDSVHARRESGAQTDVCALPNRWSSDGYLAHKLPVPPTYVVPTVPSRGVTQRGRLSVPTPSAAQQDARRVLLSDIGFTSMVPELSRSADPVWALGKMQSQGDDSITTSTSKYLSRGSSYRSPCLSMDRSNDWTPHHGYLPSKVPSMHKAWRSSLPDVRRDDTEELLEEAEIFVRRSIDNLPSPNLDLEKSSGVTGQPYIPAEPRHLRLGHTVKVITPHGRIAVGRVRYVGLAGGSAATSSVVIGAEFLHTQQPGLPRNDGTYCGRRYFLTPQHYTALFVPFSKVVMAWSN